MLEFYPQVKLVHMIAVGLSGALFLLRGLPLLAGRGAFNPAPLRYLSYTVDSVLLTAALMLVTMLHQYPFVQGWLTVKVLLLVVYVVLGVFAFKRARTQRGRVAAYLAALAVFGFIVSIARAHHPLGIFHALGA